MPFRQVEFLKLPLWSHTKKIQRNISELVLKVKNGSFLKYVLQILTKKLNVYKFYKTLYATSRHARGR